MVKRPIGRKRKVEPKVESKEYRVVNGGDISEAVEKDLKNEEGLVMFGNDNVEDEYLSLPADITEETSQELGRYFNAFTQQKMYVRTIVGRLSAIVRERKLSMDSLKAEVYTSLPPKMSLKEKDIHFTTHEEAVEKIGELHFYQEKLNMTADYLDSLVDGITLVSREISRRESDWNDDKRGDNIGKKRR